MVSLRSGCASDLAVLVRAWRLMLEECDLLGSGLVEDWEERLRLHFGSQMGGRHMQWFVAEEGGRIVGTAAVILSDGPFNIFKDLTATLAGVYVWPEYRGRGIARGLTEEAVAWCRQRGCVAVRLRASDAGRPLYESLGFTPSSEMRLDL